MQLVNRITLAHWRADLAGGISAAAVALPMGLAFGVVSGFGPLAGVYSAIWTGLCAALLGGTATQIAGPTGPIAIVMAAVFVQLAGQPEAVFSVILLAGMLQVLFAHLRIGRYINLIPYPVISGFASAVGCIIIIMQFNAILGLPAAAHPLNALRDLPASMAAANGISTAIAVATFAGCLWMPAWLQRLLPVHFTVLVCGSLLCAWLSLDVPRLPPEPSRWPELQWLPLAALPWREIWLPACVLALISSLDSLITSMAADNANQQQHDSNRELRGQGFGNILAALLGALPGAGSTMRTLTNIRAGAQTPLSGILHSLILLLVVASGASLLRYIPSALLAGILVYIGLGIIDWSYIRRFRRAPRSGIVIMVSVWLIGVLVNVVMAIAIGIVLASLALVKKMADLQLDSVEISSPEAPVSLLAAAERAAYDRCREETVLIRLSGPLTFGAANWLTRRLLRMGRGKTIVLDFTAVPLIDESIAIAFENIIQRAGENGRTVILVGLRPSVRLAFSQLGLQQMLARLRSFESLLEALEYAAMANAGMR